MTAFNSKSFDWNKIIKDMAEVANRPKQPENVRYCLTHQELYRPEDLDCEKCREWNDDEYDRQRDDDNSW